MTQNLNFVGFLTIIAILQNLLFQTKSDQKAEKRQLKHPKNIREEVKLLTHPPIKRKNLPKNSQKILKRNNQKHIQQQQTRPIMQSLSGSSLSQDQESHNPGMNSAIPSKDNDRLLYLLFKQFNGFEPQIKPLNLKKEPAKSGTNRQYKIYFRLFKGTKKQLGDAHLLNEKLMLTCLISGDPHNLIKVDKSSYFNRDSGSPTKKPRSSKLIEALDLLFKEPNEVISRYSNENNSYREKLRGVNLREGAFIQIEDIQRTKKEDKVADSEFDIQFWSESFSAEKRSLTTILKAKIELFLESCISFNVTNPLTIDLVLNKGVGSFGVGSDEEELYGVKQQAVPLYDDRDNLGLRHHMEQIRTSKAAQNGKKFPMDLTKEMEDLVKFFEKNEDTFNVRIENDVNFISKEAADKRMEGIAGKNCLMAFNPFSKHLKTEDNPNGLSVDELLERAVEREY